MSRFTDFGRLHARLVGNDDLAQICRDLPESACREQPRNYGLQVLSPSLTKVGEGLADAKLVLAWLLDAIGAPTWAMGLLVPLRESLAMLPQLVISARIRRRRIRKTVYRESASGARFTLSTWPTATVVPPIPH